MTIIIIKLIPYLEFGSASGVLPDTVFLQFLQRLLFTVTLTCSSSTLAASLTTFVYVDTHSERSELPQLSHVWGSAVSSASILSGRLRPVRLWSLDLPLAFVRRLAPPVFLSGFAPMLLATAADMTPFASCNSVVRSRICRRAAA